MDIEDEGECQHTVDNGIFCMIADHDEEASLLLLQAIAHQRMDARVAINVND